tara:strand:+ start:1092 stop:3188 length:2097 start_codon:yes stop_codon:yes gene_type:complete
LNLENYNIELNTDIKFLKGVGPQRSKVLNANNIFTIEDIIKYYPRKYLDRTNIKNISDLIIGEKAVCIVVVKSFAIKQTRKGKYFQLTLHDKTGYLNCLWFRGVSWIIEKFNVGDKVAIFGKVEFYQGLRIIHPEFDILDDVDDPINTGCIVPMYASNLQLKNVGLDSRGIRKIIINALNLLKNEIKDYFNLNHRKEEALLSLQEALYSIHVPKDQFQIKNSLYRLKYDEHFFLQILMALNKNKMETSKGEIFNNLGIHTKTMYKNLNFQLTNAQIEVLREIRLDLASGKPMNRLIQGDVGCGKTIVAALTAAIVVGQKHQVAIMAPTEILAEQHFDSFENKFNTTNIRCKLLISNIKKLDKDKIYKDLESGKIDIIIGTHALIQSKVKFKKLSLIIIDEQHRFGVEQRKKIINKGTNPHILAMTATPIPRTLAFTIHGDMEISWINEMPKNRIPIDTKIVNSKNIKIIYNHMIKEMNSGNQCYIVYPIIDESDKLNLKDAKTAFEKLNKNEFKNYKLGFMHGKLEKNEKNKLMNDFIDGNIQCLISTTVIEVGIDNPEATIMVIDNSEHFGLTQLHQLRGRVGRGNKKSYCYLIQRKKTENSNSRLSIMESTNDGFKISDEDLKLRGPGDYFGTKQHGYIKSGIINFSQDYEIIKRARKKAFEIISEDPKLSSSKNLIIKEEFLKNYKTMLEFINIG